MDENYLAHHQENQGGSCTGNNMKKINGTKKGDNGANIYIKTEANT